MRSFDKIRLNNLFKNYTAVSCIECGPLISDFPSLVNYIIPVLNRKPPYNTVCPQCGFSESKEQQTNDTDLITAAAKKVRFPRNIVSLVKSSLRQNKRPYWLLAFYKRNEK